MKYAVETGLLAMTHIASLIKIGSGFQKLIRVEIALAYFPEVGQKCYLKY
jgi:hypothetical protein